MNGYWIVKVNVLDSEKQNLYKSYASKAVKKYNGRYLVRGGTSITKEGNDFERNVVVQFPSFEDAQQAYESDEYQTAKKILGENKDRIFTIVEGYNDEWKIIGPNQAF